MHAQLHRSQGEGGKNLITFSTTVPDSAHLPHQHFLRIVNIDIIGPGLPDRPR
ncbi:MAG: hypothetical protein H6564_10185 [Lewinellaceae bacterium]|nr:hypothetical protein [Lewinellaceae bacterium]